MKLRWIAVPFVLAGALASAHLYEAIRGVHFKSASRSVDFGRPPARFANLMTTQTGSNIWRPGTTYLSADYSNSEYEEVLWEEEDRYDDAERAEARRAKELVAAYQNGRHAERRDDRAAAVALYRRMLRRGQGDIAFLRGRIDLYSEVGPGPVQGLSSYLAATAWRFDPRAALPSKFAPKLAPFVEYQAASGANLNVAALLRVAERYPGSSRAPAALIMAARALTQGKRKNYTVPDLRQADGILRTLLQRYPQSRFTFAARGGLGRIAFLKRDYFGALRHYRRQFGTADGVAQERNALNSVLLCTTALGNKAASAECLIELLPRAKERMDVVELLKTRLSKFEARDARDLGARLKRDPQLLTEYLEFRLDFTKPTPELYGFASTPGISGISLARLANAALLLRDGPRARHLARKALAKPEERDSHAMATFVLASVERRSGSLQAARKRYSGIVRRWPKSYLVGGARENLALLNERFGDLDSALDQYMALKYRDDVAYMSDIRMTPQQLDSYVRSRPRQPHRNELIYTLGMRYLRAEKWANAERTFAMLSPRERRSLTTGKGENDYEGGLQDPLATLRALRGLETKFRSVRSRSAKAAVLYETGDYYYRHRQLLLYSLPAWRGHRSQAIDYSWNSTVALAADDRALDRHHREHEALAHALRRFQRVVREYPETSSAPKAAYWGACAAARLAKFNDYWRWRDRNAAMSGEATRLLRFAERAKDPRLAKRAKKYGKVFRDQYQRDRLASASYKSPRRRFGSWLGSDAWEDDK